MTKFANPHWKVHVLREPAKGAGLSAPKLFRPKCTRTRFDLQQKRCMVTTRGKWVTFY